MAQLRKGHGRPPGIPKTGGRQKGTPNKLGLEITARLELLDCDPIQGMAVLAMDQKNSPELRGRMYAELAQYVYPKRKSIEVHAVNDGGDFTLEELLLDYHSRRVSATVQ